VVAVKIVSYTIQGVTSPATPCLACSATDNPSVVQLDATVDSMNITWAPASASYAANYSSQGAHITLTACFSTASAVSRAWRQTQPLYRKDMQCKIIIAQNVPLSGSFKYIPNDSTPTATYFIRAYVQVPSVDYGFTPIGYGQNLATQGYFQINKITLPTPGLIAAAVVCSCVGPTLLFAFLTYENIKKRS
jgi:hypothetical protein